MEDEYRLWWERYESACAVVARHPDVAKDDAMGIVGATETTLRTDDEIMSRPMSKESVY